MVIVVVVVVMVVVVLSDEMMAGAGGAGGEIKRNVLLHKSQPTSICTHPGEVYQVYQTERGINFR